jgi:hypothetical protein
VVLGAGGISGADGEGDAADGGANLSSFMEASSAICTMVSPDPASRISSTTKHEPGIRTYSRSLLPIALYRWMSLADTAVMVNMQRLPLLPMNIGFSSTLTCDAVLVTGHHTTGFPVSNF